uniref:Uncharacterized protein n=1 Tax=Fibrocapsa japonica TaxID=94617 RepID=A0A7S2UWY1_9STRA|mmetsp:Transcript_14133/g.20820  ORF Transcript_14133/g.20820 Transcript_14133/m.20820 type:complete len:275 (+) Transcript_14133:130-954(+)
MSGQGFGISGHKNNYSSSVRCGNWVEDLIGDELANTRPGTRMDLMTTNRADFRNPSRVTTPHVPDNIKMETSREIKQRNRDGQSYDLIFTHCLSEDPADLQSQRYKTTVGKSFSGGGAGEPNKSSSGLDASDTDSRARCKGSPFRQNTLRTGPPSSATNGGSPTPPLGGGGLGSSASVVSHTTLGSPGSGRALQQGGMESITSRPRTRQLLDNAAREKRVVNSYRTESNSMYSRTPKIEYKVRGPEGNVNMPNVHKSHEFSTGYVNPNFIGGKR